MKKIISVLLGVLAFSLLLAGCSKETISPEDVTAEKELKELVTDKELGTELEAQQSKEGSAMVGQAYQDKKPTCYNQLRIANKQIQILQNQLAQCQPKSLEYLLNERTIYTADIKIGGVAYPFSFDFDSQILTFKYWGDGITYELAMTKELGNYVADFKLGGVAYPIEIDWGKQPPVITLVGWPGTEGSLEYLLDKKTVYNADIKIGGVAYPFSFDFDSQILTFKYWGDGITYELAMTKELGNYVADFKLGGVAYPIKIDWGKRPPVITLVGWPGI